jgi:hypothetical protein
LQAFEIAQNQFVTATTAAFHALVPREIAARASDKTKFAGGYDFGVLFSAFHTDHLQMKLSCTTTSTTKTENIQKAGPNVTSTSAEILISATAQPIENISAMDQGLSASAIRKALAA